MEVINFLKILSSKTKNYQLVWMIVLSKISIDQDFNFSIFEIVAKTKIPIKTVYVILNFGFNFFNSINFNYQFGLKNNIIYIYQLKNKEQYIFIEKKPRNKKTKSIKPQKEETIVLVDKSIKTSKLPIIKQSKNSETIQLIINRLNQSTGKLFSPNSKSTISLINDRISEGITIEQFLFVIEIKTNQWLNDEINNKYLRPSTLFGDLMESYINENIIPNNTNTNKSKLETSYEKTIAAKRQRFGIGPKD